MSELCELFAKLTICDIHDTRQIKNQNDDVNILTQMMTNLNITKIDEVNDLINNMKAMTISDDKVTIEFKNNQVITFQYRYFNCGDKINLTMPNWCEGY